MAKSTDIILDDLIKNGGEIRLLKDCSNEEVHKAKSEGRLYVRSDGHGFIRLGKNSVPPKPHYDPPTPSNVDCGGGHGGSNSEPIAGDCNWLRR